MSLICTECEQDMDPTEGLPGRDGGMVHPIVPSLLYLPEPNAQGRYGYVLGNVRAPANTSLCYSCIENATGGRTQRLVRFYEAVVAERDYMQKEKQQEGKWINSDMAKESSDFSKRLEKAVERLDRNCIISAQAPTPNQTIFQLSQISALNNKPSIFGSYSWSSLKETGIGFNISFSAMQKHFPKTFRMLSHMLTGQEDTKPGEERRKSEIYISPEFEEALTKQTGRSIEEVIDEMIKGECVRVIRREGQ